MNTTDRMPVNSRQWWEDYFANQWDTYDGRGQTTFFMRRLVESLPAAEREYLWSQPASILDWGCAFGNGVDVLGRAFPGCRTAGMDFAERAVDEARRCFPQYEFLHTEHGEIDRPYDVIVTSHCLEHLPDPLQQMREHLRCCRHLYMILVPYREAPLYSCHVAQFREESFPERLEGFARLAAEVVDGDPVYWPGKMILAIYGSPAYVRQRDRHAARAVERQKWEHYYATLPLHEQDDLGRGFGEELATEIASFLPAGSSVLEAGCGAGWHGLALAESGKVNLTLMDYSPEALRHAEQTFTARGLSARFLCEDVLAEGAADYDLVLNMGVLEHLTFDEQVGFLRGMAGRSRKYVLAVVPNRNCYWYWMWRVYAAARGQWACGKEVPCSDLSATFEAAGLKFVGQWFGGGAWSERFIAQLPGLNDELREHLLRVHRSGVVPPHQRSYLMAVLGCKGEPASMPASRTKPHGANQFTLDQTTASLADALATTMAAEHRRTELEHTLAAKEEEWKQQLAESEQAGHGLYEDLRRRLEQIAELGDRLAEKQRDADELRILKSSRGYRLLNTVWQARLRCLPRGSRREEWAQRLMQLARRSRSGGAGSDRFAASVWQPMVNDVIERIRQSKGAVVFLPSIPWSTDLFQRPHHLARHFAREGYVAIYDCNCAGPAQDEVSGFQEIEPNLFLFRGRQRLLRRLPQATLWAFPYNYPERGRYPRRFPIVYDWMDALEVFYHHGREFIDGNHQRALREAAVIATVAQTIQAEATESRPDAVYLPNGVDYDHFAETAPPDTKDAQIVHLLEQRKPVAGYYGALASWFDYPMLNELARRRPDWNFLLIGPQIDPKVRGGRLPLEAPNITWIGPRRYQELPSYLKLFDVAMIPFQVNAITKATSPLKLYEFLAAGKPVITSPMPECEAYSEVHVARTVDEFSAALDAALEESRSDAVRERLRERGRENSWCSRVRTVAAALDRQCVETATKPVSAKDVVRKALRRVAQKIPPTWTPAAVGRRVRRLSARMFPADTRLGQGVRSAVRQVRQAPHRLLGRTPPLDLAQILRDNADRKGIVIYPPLIDWTWMKQRPHQLMRQFARAGYLSLFCSPRNRTDCFEGFVPVEPGLYLCDSLEPLYGLSRSILLIGYVHHWDLAKRFRGPRLIYDYLDDLSVSAGGAQPDAVKLELHRKLVTRSDIVLATARWLHDEVKAIRPDALFCPNAVDYAHFHPASVPPVPADMADLAAGHAPVIGYYGAMAQWFDYELVEATAKARPDWQFVLIGPDYDGSINGHSSLLRLPNVRWLGEKRYEVLPAYLHRFTVATIPFVVNDITRATSPVKLFEYMAGGKPVVTTNMPECRAQSGVLVAHDPAEYLAMLDEAIERGKQESFRQLLDEQARANTWEARMQDIIGRLEALGDQRRSLSA